MNYVRLVGAHPRLLVFGFALTLFSSFGQTFFIALFGAEIRAEFGLTHGSFGALYSLATLASGFSIIWLGGAIDRFELRRYTRAVVFGLAVGAALFGLARGPVLLVIAVYALRLFGQGLMGHTALTTMARFFRQSRGKALSIAALGFPAGEALFPRAFVGLKSVLGWREAWWVVAAVILFVLWPFVEWLFRSLRTDDAEASVTRDATDDPTADGASWTRGAVLRDPRFYAVLPAVLAPPFIATGIFFHQVALVESKGWTLEFFATTFVAFAATQLGASITVGPLVDRFRASRLLFIYLLPLALALVLLAVGGHPVFAIGFMLAAGFTSGSVSTVVGAYWVEAYGPVHLGAIRSMAMALMVFSTAAAPVALGRMIDRGTTFEAIALGCFVYVLVASVLAGRFFNRGNHPSPASLVA